MRNWKAFPCVLRGILALFSFRLESENQGQSQNKDKMHRLVFGHSFAELVALILLGGLAFYFLNKKKASAHGNAEHVDIGASGLLTAPTETNSGRSSASPTETNDGASSLSPAETNSGGSSSFPVETKHGASSSSSPTKTTSSGSSLSSIETSNGASSLLTASIGNFYEVFLSFRGLDTRKSFTDHLYNGLLDAGIDAFRDDDELRQGENIRPELLAAITNSKILIPILSVNYGTSSWCLDELVQIMECKNNNGRMVLPIFYNVKPSHVGHQSGSFGDVFHERERRLLERHFDPTILEKWKKALLEVSTLKGYEADGYEAKLVKSLVRKVLSELKKKFELDISENLIGIDSHVKEVMEFVNNKSHATLFVGIHGMGGIGKTTLAKAIYNKISNQFEHRSFIADIRESWKRNEVHYLQNLLIYDILKRENEVHNEDEGTKFISSKFKGIKVLVLLDDVDNVVQLKRLAGNRDWFSLGSKIIITTRNKRILEEVRVDYAYEHKEMDNDQSLILFSKHAFRKDFPLREFKDLTHEVVSITKGLPLSLEVLGSLLCGQELAFWRGTIDKLVKVPPKEVRAKLRISYEALDYEQKQIFLDIACFLIGTDRRIASYMWDACRFFPEEGIEVLTFMSLIKVGNDHKLRMHDQLRDLGREIVREEDQREPRYRSRLWDFEEVQKVLKENEGTTKIEAIILSKGSSECFGKMSERDGDICIEKQLKNLTGLRFLHLEGAHLSGDFENSIERLRWLRWQNCPMNFQVNNFHVKELLVFELLEGKINDKWEGWRSSFMMAKKLKSLDLTSCESLENTIFLSAFKHLEVLILNGCRRLKQINSSIGDMNALLRLELCKCISLKELPTEIGKLKALKQLLLQHTPKLYALPDSIGSLENLEILDIYGSGIEELPNDIGRLRKLRELHVAFCRNLKGKMPESMGSLENLEILDISWSGIEELPNGIGRLRKLRHLDASNCSDLKGEMPDSIENLEILDISGSGIEELPNSFGRLTKLRELRASYCRNLRGEMPESMCNLSSLQCLDVHGCTELQSLPNHLPSSLTYLGVTCQSHKLPSLSHLTHLKELKVISCEFLECIQELPSTLLKNSECSQPIDIEESKLPQSLNTPFKLEILKVLSCNSIETLDVSQFIHLRTLSAEYCKNLYEVRGLDKLIYLESLTVSHCDSIKRLDLPKLDSMKTLDVIYCDELAEIEGLDRLEFLESLLISWCTSIERLLLPKSESLKLLHAGPCYKLTEIQGLDKLEFLESLDIFWCTSIERLLLPKSESLKKLKVGGCKNLAEIQGLDRLECLESLYVFNFPSLERLLLPKSESLKELKAENCKNLVEIQGLDKLEFLEMLNIQQCTSIERLDLRKSGRLKKLHAKDCKNLAEIQGLDKLEFLKVLNTSGCKSLKTIPEKFRH